MKNFTLLFLLISSGLSAQTELLLGRWEVLTYSEQGIQVDKKQAPTPQALAVYDHIREQRAERWYGYDAYNDFSRREERAFERWSERDSIQETQRISEAIETPFFVVFFPDSTLSMYNKIPGSNQIKNAAVRQFNFSPKTMSIDITPGVGLEYSMKSDAQVLKLSANEMTLFLPETAEIVLLRKTEYSIP
jgi:hypothetical protein